MPVEWPAARTILRGSQKVDFVILTKGKDLATNRKQLILRNVYPEPKSEILRGVYPAQKNEILRFAQDDKAGLRMTGGEGLRMPTTSIDDFLRNHHPGFLFFLPPG
jgi:hypothetical protein